MAHHMTCLSDEEFVDLLGIWRGAEWWPQSLTDRLLLEAEKRGYDTIGAAWRDRALRARALRARAQSLPESTPRRRPPGRGCAPAAWGAGPYSRSPRAVTASARRAGAAAGSSTSSPEPEDLMPERTIVFDGNWEAGLWDRAERGIGLRLVDRASDGAAVVQVMISHQLSEVDVMREFLRRRGGESLLDEYERERDAIWTHLADAAEERR